METRPRQIISARLCLEFGLGERAPRLPTREGGQSTRAARLSARSWLATYARGAKHRRGREIILLPSAARADAPQALDHDPVRAAHARSGRHLHCRDATRTQTRSRIRCMHRGEHSRDAHYTMCLCAGSPRSAVQCELSRTEDRITRQIAECSPTCEGTQGKRRLQAPCSTNKALTSARARAVRGLVHKMGLLGAELGVR